MRQVLEKLGLLRQPGEMKVGRAWTKHRIYDHSYRAISKTCFAVTVGLSAWMAYKFIHYRLYKKEAVSDTVRMLMEQKMAEKQAEAEQELMAGVTEKGSKVQ